MYFVVSRQRRARLIEDAGRARASDIGRACAFGLIIFYNLVGVLDIISTSLAIGRGLGEEANPFLRAMMAQFGPGWIIGKLALQSLVSAMVIWFPHPYVLGLFGPAVLGNAIIVGNNFMIAAGV